MKKAAAVVALFLCLAVTALAAAATIKVVDDPSGLPKPFSRIAQKGDIFASGGPYAAVIAATPRPLWSSINYGHPDVAGYVAAFLPSGAAARPEAEFGYASVRSARKPSSRRRRPSGSRAAPPSSSAPRARAPTASASISSSATPSPSTPAASTYRPRSATPDRPRSRASASASGPARARAITSARSTRKPSRR